jgi:hypothetical protein
MSYDRALIRESAAPMTTVQINRQRARPLYRRDGGQRLLVPLIVAAAVALSAFGYVAYVLWPRWSAPRLDTPPLPITVAGVAFNVPPAAIRVAAQRRAGAQERIDLVFLWPSLQPPDPVSKPAAVPGTEPASSPTSARVFMSIAGAGDTLAPADRARTIYPRHTAAEAVRGADGLAVLAFRDGTPYAGEDLVYAPETAGFLMRCTRGAPAVPGICLYERRIDRADIVVRFPRDWLDDWRRVAATLDRLIASLRPPR